MQTLILKWKSYQPYYKRNLRLAFPIMLTQIGAALVGFFDTIMIGHYSTSALAAVSVSNAIFFSVIVLNMGIIMGITPLISFETGKKDKNTNTPIIHYQHTVSSILHNGLLITIILTLITMLLLSICLHYFDQFGQEPIVCTEAKPYLLLINLSTLPFLLFCFCKQFLEGVGNTTVAMKITICINLLNIFLNWILIYGHLGLQPMGATGAGWATLISRSIMPCLFFTAICKKKEWRQLLKMFSFQQIQTTNIKQIVNIGLPIGMQTFLETILFTLSFVFIGWINKESLAAHNIANQIAEMTFMLAIGIGAATTIRISYQYGCRNIHALRMAANASIHLVLLFNSLGAFLMISCRNIIPHIFSSDPAVLSIASQLILCAGLFQYADGMQAIGISILRGLTDVKIPMIAAFFSYILVALPTGLLLTFKMHLNAMGMWIGFIIGLSLAAILFHLRIRSDIRKLSLKQRDTK